MPDLPQLGYEARDQVFRHAVGPDGVTIKIPPADVLRELVAAQQAVI